jgi:hypothetical protein
MEDGTDSRWERRALIIGAEAAKNDYGNEWLQGFDNFKNVRTALPGQVKIKQQEVRLAADKVVLGFVGVSRSDYVKAGLEESQPEGLAKRLIIFSNQNAFAH